MSLEEQLSATLQDPSRRPSPLLAERVMSALPARRARWRPARPSWSGPLGAAAVLAIVLVVGPSLVPPNGVAPLATRPSPAASGTARFTAPPSTVAPTVVGAYADGMPRQINGEPVLRGDAIGREAARRTNDTPFLIGGYVVLVMADCMIDPSAPTSPLLAACGDGYHLRDGPRGDMEARVVIDPMFAGPVGLAGLQVLRAHVHDRRAEACASAIRRTCEQTIVVEAVAWAGSIGHPLDADGIPVEIDGEPVLRGDDITAQIAAATDDRSFLVGGWATGPIAYRCAAETKLPDVAPQPRDVAPSARRPLYMPLLACGSSSIMLMDEPDGEDGVVVRMASLSTAGAIVLRVHVHDVRAAACPTAMQTTCDTTVVLEEVVWSRP